MEHDGCINFLTYYRGRMPRNSAEPWTCIMSFFPHESSHSGPNIAIEVDRWKPPLAASLPDVAKVIMITIIL
ncbi:hypothetical protein OIU85_001976 [Salix viminalis]|uniref:Uncharacterized protein n=1 Tax=Salix viminalis TaxID=40686 RepID=A0A9Q0ZYM9_SALVM|nr:hypothetical protein OIU85_001976 [Salix viminalis]